MTTLLLYCCPVLCFCLLQWLKCSVFYNYSDCYWQHCYCCFNWK